ncbi:MULTISPECIES: Cof-type HAD-IIB family hydrolase [unclassified Providencia]|uniref:Cof-type HAD-IIB family hydrolase n=1 Tax=unclassified Providencia TaxID=2633465 RepID=UPI00234947E1|nr:MULTISPECIES: Cof-type HAD-IIB family hydrolase [unclassified Providencia]
MYNVLALDLDGTVLTQEHTIHPAVKQAIQQAAKQCHVMIVTGRHHTAARPYYDELGLTTPIICCNGTYIYDYQNEKVITHNALTKENALTFIELAQNDKLKMVMYITDAMVYSKIDPIDYMSAMEQWANDPTMAHPPKIYRIDSFEEQVQQADYIWKFVVEGEPSTLERFLNSPWIKQTFNAEKSWSNRFDFAAKGNNKGTRLAEYLNSQGYNSNQVIAVGDNHNDISMIELAGLGVAMKNADDTVKSHANAICATDNSGDGLARLIHENILGQSQ